MRARAIAFLYEASIEFEKTCPRIVWKWRRRGLLNLADVRSQLSDARDGLAPSDKVEEMIHTLIEARLRVLPWDSTILTEESHRQYARKMFAPYCRTLRGVVPGA